MKWFHFSEKIFPIRIYAVDTKTIEALITLQPEFNFRNFDKTILFKK